MTASTPTDLTDLAAPLTPPAPASLMDGFIAGPDLFVKEEMGLGTVRSINTKSKRRPLHGRPSSKAKIKIQSVKLTRKYLRRVSSELEAIQAFPGSTLQACISCG